MRSEKTHGIFLNPKAIERTPRTALKVGTRLLEGTLLLLLILINYSLYQIDQRGEVNRGLWILLNVSGTAGILGTYFFYWVSKPNVDELLAQFESRHPDSPALKKYREAEKNGEHGKSILYFNVKRR